MAEEGSNPLESLIYNNECMEPTEPPFHETSGPHPTFDDIVACQFSNWYSIFSNLPEGSKRKNVTIPSIILSSLPDQFLDYLLSDGVLLPQDATQLSSLAAFPERNNGDDDSDAWSSADGKDNNHGGEKTYGNNNNDDDDDDDDLDSSHEIPGNPQQFSFPDLNQQILRAINDLGGSVMPKLNWSSPRDATWVHGGSLKCQTPGDVYLLLKSSDFCLHDILHAFDDSTSATTESSIQPTRPPTQLVLRKWCNLYPSMEFRCFVRQDELLAISQRNHSQHYPHLAIDMTWIQTRILDFFYNTIQHIYAHDAIHNYVMDVYLDKKQRVWLVDFNVWGRSTDPLLFEWSELISLDMEDDPYFRIVDTPHQIRQDPLASYRAPIDTVDLANLTGGASTQFQEFMDQCQR